MKKEPSNVIEKREKSSKRRKRLKKKVSTSKFSKHEKNILVGIDPGAKTLVTAVVLVDQAKLDNNIEKFLHINDKNRIRIKKTNIKCDKSVESALKLTDADRNLATVVFSFSGSQYYHDTKVNKKIVYLQFI